MLRAACARIIAARSSLPFPSTDKIAMTNNAEALLKHRYDFWLARGAIAATAALNAFLINNLTVFPWWLASTV